MVRIADVKQDNPDMTPRQAWHNEQLNYLQLIWATPYLVVLQQYIPVLATRLGASALLIGLLSAGAALMLTIGTTVARWWVQRAPADMRAVAIPAIGARAIVLWVPLVLFLNNHQNHQAEWLVAGTLVCNLFIGITQVPFMSSLARMTLPERTPILISGRWTTLGIGNTIGIPIIALALDLLPLPWNYLTVCSLATLTSAVELMTFLRWKPRPIAPDQRTRRSASADLRQIWRHIPARRYLLLVLLANFGLSSISPLLPLQLVRHLQATNVQYGWYATMSWLAIALTGVIRPGLIRRFGNGLIYALAGFGLAAEALTLGLAQSLTVTWIAGAIGGIATGLFQVAAFGLIAESAPPELYEGFVGIQASVGNFAVFAAPLITAGLLSAGAPMGFTLYLCAAARALAGGLSFAAYKLRSRPGAPEVAAPRPAGVIEN
jgi:MFS family permease